VWRTRKHYNWAHVTSHPQTNTPGVLCYKYYKEEEEEKKKDDDDEEVTMQKISYMYFT
jgi:hypothetical protein